MDVLVCARATAAEVIAANSSFDRHCSRCGARVVIAPSGQRLLREKSGVEIICMPCVPRVAAGFAAGASVTLSRPPGCDDEIAGAVPNFWRKRN